MNLLRANIKQQIITLLTETRTSLHIVSPYISSSQIRVLSEYLSPDVRLQILTRFNYEEYNAGLIDLNFIKVLKENFKHLSVYLNEDLHAKIYLFDSRTAIIASANLTEKGMTSNIEYGILVSDITLVGQIKRDIESFISVSKEFDEFMKMKEHTNPTRIYWQYHKQLSLDRQIQIIEQTKYNREAKTQDSSRIAIDPEDAFYFKGSPSVMLGDTVSVTLSDKHLGEQFLVVGFHVYEVLSKDLIGILRFRYEEGSNLQVDFAKMDEYLPYEFQVHSGWITAHAKFKGFSVDERLYNNQNYPHLVFYKLAGMTIHVYSDSWRIIAVDKNSTADKHDIKASDLILKIGNNPGSEWFLFLKSQRGKKISLTTKNIDGQIKTCALTLDEIKRVYCYALFEHKTLTRSVLYEEVPNFLAETIILQSMRSGRRLILGKNTFYQRLEEGENSFES